MKGIGRRQLQDKEKAKEQTHWWQAIMLAFK
jgi:hypothetical protein